MASRSTSGSWSRSAPLRTARDAWHQGRRLRVDGQHAGVGVGRANEGSVQRAGELQVGEESPPSRQQPGILVSRHRSPDPAAGQRERVVGRPRQGEIRYIVTVAKAEERAIAEARAELERALGRWQELAGELAAAETDSGIPVAPVYTALDVPGGAGDRPTRRASVHPWHPRCDVSEASLHDASLCGLGGPGGDERALPLPARAGADRALGRPRPAHADGPRLGPRARRGRGGQGRSRDRLACRHGAALRGDPARPGLHLVHDQRDGADPARHVPGGRRDARASPRPSCAARFRTTSSRSSWRARRTSTRRAPRCAWWET